MLKKNDISIAKTSLKNEQHFVSALNKIYYYVESSVYDDLHIEVVVGDLDWWKKAGKTYLIHGNDTPQRIVLDVGCGTGFVGTCISSNLNKKDLLIGCDISTGMLSKARNKEKLMDKCTPVFINCVAHQLPISDSCIDLVTINSVLHHLANVKATLSEIDRVLKPGGIVLINREPNKAFFQSLPIRLLASLYKLIGGGIDVTDDIEMKVNNKLLEINEFASPLNKYEIQRYVEYHSPVEQSRVWINKEKGFYPSELTTETMKNYSILEQEEFTTFFVRPIFEKLPWLGRIISYTWCKITLHGNLFRLVLKKPELD